MSVIRIQHHTPFRVILKATLFVVFLVAFFTVTEDAYARSLNKTLTSEPVRTIDGVQQAVIQIATVGTYVDPSEILPFTSSGRGSGFIIDPSGLAMTNNHIVTGATYINVWIDGEDSPRSAKVVAVSECADLAIIDIEGDGFPYLEWSEQSLYSGMEVYAAGFPGGHREYALTRGAIANMTSDGDTHWAALTHVIEHNAEIAPGSSGGPLMDSSGKVVAINYAGPASGNEYFAISREQVLPLLDPLRAGQDVDAIGINGLAVVVGSINPLTGIWVSSIQIGSAAHRAGILPGDILIALDDVLLATDGSMADYCDVLRRHAPTDVLNLRVLRRSNRQVLAGQLNGYSLRFTLPFHGNFMNEQFLGMREGLGQGMLIDPISKAEIQSRIGGVALENSYVSIQSSAVTAILPVAWLDIASDIWTIGNDWLGLKFQASTDLEAMTEEEWTAPGAIIYTSSELAPRMVPGDFLTTIDLSKRCASRERFTHTHSVNISGSAQTHRGAYDHWRDCGTVGREVIIFVVVDDRQERLYLVEFYILGPADLEAFEVFRKTFHFSGSGLIETEIEPPPPPPIQPTPVPTPSGPVSNLDLQAPEGTLSIELSGIWRTTETGEWIVNEQDSAKSVGFQLVAEPEAGDEALSQVTYRIATDLQDTPKSTTFLDKYKYAKKCGTVARKGYRNGANRGAYDLWTDCDDGGFAYVIAATEPMASENNGENYILALFVQLNDLAGIDAIEPMLATLQYGPPAAGTPAVTQSSAPAVAEPVAATPEPATEIATPVTATDVTATVAVPGLNVRNGPGTNYDRIGRATLDQRLQVQGQSGGCAWLQVITPNNISGWVSGNPEYVTLNGDCSAIAR